MIFPGTFLCIFLGLFFSGANATMFAPAPLPELVQSAPTIARGTIGSSRTEWVRDSSGGRRIFTFYGFQVQEALKGDIGGAVQIRELGGEKDGIGMRISGTAEFSPGEDVVVLLGPKNADGSYDVRGLSSGKFDLEKKPDGDECLSGVALAANGEEDAMSDSREGCRWDLASLRRIVREQGAAPVARVSPAASPSMTFSASAPAMAPFSTTSRPAPSLQPSPAFKAEAEPKTQLWIVVLVAASLGLLAVLLFNKPNR